MTRDEALQLARNVAVANGVELDELAVARAAGASPDAHHWALVGWSAELPSGWSWVFNLNDCGEDQVMIAHHSQSSAERTRQSREMRRMWWQFWNWHR